MSITSKLLYQSINSSPIPFKYNNLDVMDINHKREAYRNDVIENNKQFYQEIGRTYEVTLYILFIKYPAYLLIELFIIFNYIVSISFSLMIMNKIYNVTSYVIAILMFPCLMLGDKPLLFLAPISYGVGKLFISFYHSRYKY
jgi:hypothetical protein